jgi:hypothetical protein
MVVNGSDSSTQDSLRKRIQRIETLLHGRQPTSEPQHSISSALAGIEKLLGIPPLEPSEHAKNSIITPVHINDPTLSPTTLPSPGGSQSSQLRTAFLAEANHKRWGAESAIGQSWSKVPARIAYSGGLLTIRFRRWILDCRLWRIRWDCRGRMSHLSLRRHRGGYWLIFLRLNMRWNCSMHMWNSCLQFTI